jgi:hypothetical protein
VPKYAMKSQGESINHFNGVRVRVVGSGNLDVAAYVQNGMNTDSLDQTLVPYAMSTATHRQPTLGLNVKKQRMSLEIKITEINEWFAINRLIVYMKPLYTSFPGRG